MSGAGVDTSQPGGNWIVGKASGAYTLTQALTFLQNFKTAVDNRAGVPRPCDTCAKRGIAISHETTWDVLIVRADSLAYAYRCNADVVAWWPTFRDNHAAVAAAVNAGALSNPGPLDVSWVGATRYQ